MSTVVLRENDRQQRFSRSSREFPSRSITITQQLPSLPMLKTFGMLISSPISFDFARSMMNFDSSSNWDRFMLALYIFRATSEPSFTFFPRQIYPKAPQPSFFTISQQPRTRLGFYDWEALKVFIPSDQLILFPPSVCLNKYSHMMFEPHSIRGLLSRRKKTRLDSQEQLESAPAGGDSDFNIIVEGKLFIKDVQHKIEDIRQWRDHQNSLLRQKLASNEAVAKVTVDEYLKHLEREEKTEAEQREKMMKKLKIGLPGDDLKAEEWTSSDTNLFECLAASNRTVDERKYEQDNDEGVLSNSQTLFNDLENISQNILRRQDKNPQKKNENLCVDRALIKKQLQEIDDELREIQEMLKD